MVLMAAGSSNGSASASGGRPSIVNVGPNVVNASTSGSGLTLLQSNPRVFAKMAAVAGRVRASKRSAAVALRRAPASAVMTVPLATAISSARTTSERQRLGNSSRSQPITTFIAR